MCLVDPSRRDVFIQRTYAGRVLDQVVGYIFRAITLLIATQSHTFHYFSESFSTRLINMRCILAFTTVLALGATHAMAAYPVNFDALQKREAEVAQETVEHYYSSFFKRSPQGGNAFTGSSGDVSGGNVSNEADGDGTVSNTDGSCE